VSSDPLVRGAVDRALAELRAPLNAALQSLGEHVAGEMQTSYTRLVDALWAIDQAQSLGEVLSVASECVAREADRAAVLLVRPERVTGWRWLGFEGAADDARSIAFNLDEAGLVGAAVHRARVTARQARTARTPADDLPLFARGAGERDAVAAPIPIAGTVVAVLYADEPAVNISAPPWMSVVEVLGRYTGLVLEARVARHLTGAGAEHSGVRVHVTQDHALSETT
jgi:hypothetical protein